MKYRIKTRVLALGLAISMLLGANAALAASTGQNTLTIEDRSLAEFVIHLSNDPMASQINFDGTDLSYVMTDGTFVTMSETVESDGIRIWTVNQQGAIDKLKINAQENKIFLNDTPVSFEVLPTATIESDYLRADNWHKMGTGTKYHMQLETLVRSSTSALLYSLMFSVMGTIGTALGIAKAIIDIAIALNSKSTALFVSRQMYRDDQYLKYKYEDDYYFDKNYTDFAYSNVTIEISANR